MHLAVANWFALCVPFIVCDAASAIADDLTNDDWTGYAVWLVIAAALAVWARIAAVRVLRGDPFRRALGAALRRPALFVYFIVACAEPWLTDFGSTLVALPLFFAGSLIVFAAMLALVASVSDDVSPARALAYWLREMCRPRRLGVNLAGALIVAFLTIVLPDLLEALPGTGWQPLRYLFAVPEGLGDAFAMTFVVLWYDAVLDDRYGRDIEQLLDAKPARISPGA